VGNDVVLGTAVDRTHGNNGRILRINFARHDGLPAYDGSSGDHDRIDRLLRGRAVAANSIHRNVYRIGIRRAEARCVADFAGRQSVAVVHRKNEVWLGKARKQAVFDHGLGATDTFLGRLSDIDKGSVPSVFILHQQGGGSDANRQVQI